MDLVLSAWGRSYLDAVYDVEVCVCGAVAFFKRNIEYFADPCERIQLRSRCRSGLNDEQVAKEESELDVENLWIFLMELP